MSEKMSASDRMFYLHDAVGILHQNGTQDHADACKWAVERIEALQQEADAMREALEPFSAMAGELFAQNWNRSDIVIQKAAPGGQIITVTAGHFFDARAALNGSPQDQASQETQPKE